LVQECAAVRLRLKPKQILKRKPNAAVNDGNGKLAKNQADETSATDNKNEDEEEEANEKEEYKAEEERKEKGQGMITGGILRRSFPSLTAALGSQFWCCLGLNL
jgi:hypothetical protein